MEKLVNNRTLKTNLTSENRFHFTNTFAIFAFSFVNVSKKSVQCIEKILLEDQSNLKYKGCTHFILKNMTKMIFRNTNTRFL